MNMIFKPHANNSLYLFFLFTAPPGFPAISQSTSSMQSVFQGNPTELSCLATGNSPLRYLWIKDGIYIDTKDPRISISFSG